MRLIYIIVYAVAAAVKQGNMPLARFDIQLYFFLGKPFKQLSVGISRLGKPTDLAVDFKI